jgi:hypothetical protein
MKKRRLIGNLSPEQAFCIKPAEIQQNPGNSKLLSPKRSIYPQIRAVYPHAGAQKAPKNLFNKLLKKGEGIIARSEATPARPVVLPGRAKQSPSFSGRGDCFAPGACPERSEGVARNDTCFSLFQHPVNKRSIFFRQNNCVYWDIPHISTEGRDFFKLNSTVPVESHVSIQRPISWCWFFGNS